MALLARRIFQSPFRRGNGYYTVRRIDCAYRYPSFSPLFIGAMVATVGNVVRGVFELLTFSPLFIGAMVATSDIVANGIAFSPLFVGAMVATQHYREIK